MPYKENFNLPGSTQDTFIKNIFCRYKKRKFRNAWSDLGHFYEKNFFAAIKKNEPFWDTFIKKNCPCK